MKRALIRLTLASVFLITAVAAEEPAPDPAKDKAAFEQAAGGVN